MTTTTIGDGKAATAPVTRAEFEMVLSRLEDLEDAETIRNAEARGDHKDALPLALAERLFAGESPVRIWRLQRGLTLEQLGEKVGTGKSFLSQIEAGKKQPSLATVKKIAAALKLGLDDLV